MWMFHLLPVFYVLLNSFTVFGTSDSFQCPCICECLSDSIRCNKHTEDGRRNCTLAKQPPSTLDLILISLKDIGSLSFDGLDGVNHIRILNSVVLETIQPYAFNNLSSLEQIYIKNSKNLVHIAQRAFNNLPRLQCLEISNTGIMVFPDLTAISSGVLRVLEISDNPHLTSVPPNAFLGIDQNPELNMKLFNNGFKEIQSHAFNGTTINELILRNNRNLRLIHREAFTGARGPITLDVSSTALEVLPPHGLESVIKLVAKAAFALKSLPSFNSLPSLCTADLTYPSHCCALNAWYGPRETLSNLSIFHDVGMAKTGSSNSAVTDDATSADKEDTDHAEIHFDYGFDQAFECTPEPDAFNPCEDLAGFSFLRVAIWFINVLAIIGNLTVLLVLFGSGAKLTVPRFLMCHLAFADLCIGVYLLMIAAVDLRTQGHYSQHAIVWQTGAGCGVAGFLAVFGGELSVYTLCNITLERWHTIAHAMQLERRLGLSHAVAIMAGGWLLCLAVALLPLLGVSSYSKVSMCLPMDIDSALAQAFVIVLLLLNVAAFLVVCVCYVRIYLAVRNPEFPGRRGAADAKMAKRMAVLIFTDFLCMAPISFFAISAAFRAPLITVTNSKILLVLFYPINSCANPFLYAIFTKAFRRDACKLLRALGCCESKLGLYCVKEYCAGNMMGHHHNNKQRHGDGKKVKGHGGQRAGGGGGGELRWVPVLRNQKMNRFKPQQREVKGTEG